MARKTKPTTDPANRCQCQACGHTVPSEEEWKSGCDLAPSIDLPEGIQDSGKYMCPKCGEFAGFTMFDAFVTYDTAGFVPALQVYLDEDTARELVGSINVEDLRSASEQFKTKAYFNIGSAIMNAVQAKKAILTRWADEELSVIYPADHYYGELAQ